MRSSSTIAALALGLLLAAVVAVVLITRDGDDDAGPTRADLERPAIEVPDGDPPEELQITDVTVGEGDEASAGDEVTVEYLGVAFSTGEQFDASWDRDEPFSFPLGGGQVIEGWDEGVQGMRVGGRRELLIPPEQAYGEAGSPPAIGPDETLIFVVDLLAVD